MLLYCSKSKWLQTQRHSCGPWLVISFSTQLVFTSQCPSAGDSFCSSTGRQSLPTAPGTTFAIWLSLNFGAWIPNICCGLFAFKVAKHRRHNYMNYTDRETSWSAEIGNASFFGRQLNWTFLYIDRMAKLKREPSFSVQHMCAHVRFLSANEIKRFEWFICIRKIRNRRQNFTWTARYTLWNHVFDVTHIKHDQGQRRRG